YRLGRKTKNKKRDRPIRTIKVTNHEIGHVLGIPPVDGKGCLMHEPEATIDTVAEETALACEPPRSGTQPIWDLRLPEPAGRGWPAVRVHAQADRSPVGSEAARARQRGLAGAHRPRIGPMAPPETATRRPSSTKVAAPCRRVGRAA